MKKIFLILFLLSKICLAQYEPVSPDVGGDFDTCNPAKVRVMQNCNSNTMSSFKPNNDVIKEFSNLVSSCQTAYDAYSKNCSSAKALPQENAYKTFVSASAPHCNDKSPIMTALNQPLAADTNSIKTMCEVAKKDFPNRVNPGSVEKPGDPTKPDCKPGSTDASCTANKAPEETTPPAAEPPIKPRPDQRTAGPVNPSGADKQQPQVDPNSVEGQKQRLKNEEEAKKQIAAEKASNPFSNGALGGSGGGGAGGGGGSLAAQAMAAVDGGGSFEPYKGHEYKAAEIPSSSNDFEPMPSNVGPIGGFRGGFGLSGGHGGGGAAGAAGGGGGAAANNSQGGFRPPSGSDSPRAPAPKKPGSAPATASNDDDSGGNRFFSTNGSSSGSTGAGNAEAQGNDPKDKNKPKGAGAAAQVVSQGGIPSDEEMKVYLQKILDVSAKKGNQMPALLQSEGFSAYPGAFQNVRLRYSHQYLTNQLEN